MRFKVLNIGCKVNRVEVDAASAQLIEQGACMTSDADADIVSLSLTIPNWTRMMYRAKNSTAIENTSVTGRAKLLTSLLTLRRTCDLLMDWLKENMSNGV